MGRLRRHVSAELERSAPLHSPVGRAWSREPVRFRHRGMQVVYRAHPGELTAIALSVRAGARFDGSHPGLAHLAEHMLFQGTTSLDQVALNRRAAELGGEHNADTGYEDIALTFEVFNEDLDAGLGLLADQYYRTQIDAKRFRKERRVVLEEIRGRLDDPADRVYRRAWSRFFDGALAHPVCGSLGSVRAIETAHVTVFLRRQFDHANTVLAIVGGVSLAQARAAVEKHFQGGVSNRPARAPAVRIRGAGHVRLRQSNGSQAYFAKLMPVAHKPRHLLATGVALDLVGADPDSRLFQELRERLGLSYELSSSLEWGPDWAVAIISASAARSRADRLMKAVEETCRRAAREGFEDADVKRARKKIRYRYALLDDNRLDQALALAESVLWGLPTPKEAEQIVCSLTLEEINAAWRRAVAAPCVTALLS